MDRMEELIATHTTLTETDVTWLRLLVEQWDLLADLAFSDLILWVPDVDDNIFWAVAQIRPTTGPTALEDDVIGEDIAYDAEHLVVEAYLTHQPSSVSDGQLNAGIPVDVRAIPIVIAGRCIAIVEMHTNRMGLRAPGDLEDNYVECAARLVSMIERNEFPMQAEQPDPWVRPKLGDGSIRVDNHGVVTYASPNAVSAYRRLGLVGDLLGEDFKGVSRSLNPMMVVGDEQVVDTNVRNILPSRIELAVGNNTISMWVLPLRNGAVSDGVLILCRDITEVRIRERQLVTKDATIREIHHRVKNNLQTVAALLRLQARRAPTIEAKKALDDAMKRVGAIAVVHQILSQSYSEEVAFDDVADRLLSMVGDVAATTGSVATERTDSFGLVPAEMANSLSIVLAELCQNAVEHGFASSSGRVILRPIRTPSELIMEVVNDGERLPDDFSLTNSSSLGLSIVATLVSDLGGTFTLERGIGDQTVARVRLPLDSSS